MKSRSFGADLPAIEFDLPMNSANIPGIVVSELPGHPFLMYFKPNAEPWLTEALDRLLASGARTDVTIPPALRIYAHG
jgi:hypothetical protein